MLEGDHHTVRPFDIGEVRATMAASLDANAKPPARRAPAPAAGLDLSALAGEPGQIDVDRIVRSVRGEQARVRQSQRDMVGVMRDWIAAGTGALVEAPTGTGKTFAILANALEWLGSDPRNRVVISTYTKALQRQLAEMLFDLDEKGVVPGLLATTSLIKGASNRLSLAGLVRALADCTATSRVARRRLDYVGDPLFAEFAMYLALRFVATGTPVEEWESHSTDPNDIEPFFEAYLAGGPGRRSRRDKFLSYLSQAESPDYRAGETAPAEHTSLVKEVLGAHRLLVTNHALLLAHLSDFTDPEHTLLVIDEAHSLENAATDAIETHVDYGLLEEATSELRDWMRPLPVGSAADALARHAILENALRRLDGFLDNETVPRFASRALDAAGRDLLHPDALRVVTLASPVTRPAPPRDGIAKAMTELATRITAVANALEHEPRR
jgi:ATP-dependent DNA helicase RecQ